MKHPDLASLLHPMRFLDCVRCQEEIQISIDCSGASEGKTCSIDFEVEHWHLICPHCGESYILVRGLEGQRLEKGS